MTAAARKLATVAPMVAKLIKLLASDKDGEVLASVCALRRVLAKAGLDLNAVATMIERPSRSSDQADNPDQPQLDWQTIAKHCATYPQLLSARERSFVRSMTAWCGHPSDRQCLWLASIYERIREAA